MALARCRAGDPHDPPDLTGVWIADPDRALALGPGDARRPAGRGHRHEPGRVSSAVRLYEQRHQQRFSSDRSLDPGPLVDGASRAPGKHRMAQPRHGCHRGIGSPDQDQHPTADRVYDRGGPLGRASAPQDADKGTRSQGNAANGAHDRTPRYHCHPRGRLVVSAQRPALQRPVGPGIPPQYPLGARGTGPPSPADRGDAPAHPVLLEWVRLGTRDLARIRGLDPDGIQRGTRASGPPALGARASRESEIHHRGCEGGPRSKLRDDPDPGMGRGPFHRPAAMDADGRSAARTPSLPRYRCVGPVADPRARSRRRRTASDPRRTHPAPRIARGADGISAGCASARHLRTTPVKGSDGPSCGVRTARSDLRGPGAASLR